MPKILNQRDARAIKKLPFCYVCGNAFAGRENATDDHVPPQAAFLPDDRENFPLTLPTHRGCNHTFHLEDELLGQLVSLANGKDASINRLKLSSGSDGAGRLFSLLENVDLHGAIRRWVAAFHAALYQEPLPPLTRFSTQSPLPSGRVVGGVVIPDTPVPQFVDYARQVDANEALGSVDCIRSNNGKLNYRCCWQRSDGGPWIALYRLDLYEWSSLGDIDNFSPRPCVGAYAPPGGIPPLATRGTELWPVYT